MEKRVISPIVFLIVSAGVILLLRQNTPAQAGPASPPDPALRPSQAVTVEFGGALGFVYAPKDIFVEPGSEVRWKGVFAEHPLVSEDDLWQMVDSGLEFTYTFTQPGLYRYHCFFHGSSGMSGTVRVGYRVLLPQIQN
jgi:plastocyanin